jgi:galactosamine-6-phosphate isomerase
LQIHILSDYEAVSAYTADTLQTLLKAKPAAVVCIASGDSPRLACEMFVTQAKTSQLDTSQLSFVGLDEWVGLPATLPGTCASDFMKRLIVPLALQPHQYHLFDGRSLDLKAECEQMDQWLATRGGIDIMIVGIGMNGHIGFNEPGAGAHWLSHVMPLAELTQTVGQRYFEQPVQVTQGITLGLGHLMQARQVLLLANGERKASVIAKAVTAPVSTHFPASILQQHAQAQLVIDRAAATLLPNSTA